ncbi:WD40-repeat-containing domain protein [Lactarius deliciosus]|nr:WD40-repeat-containing domain protein [Lactarius deliciosus]
MSHNTDSPTEGNGRGLGIMELLHTIMQMRAFGNDQAEGDDESTRELFHQSLSSGFRLVRLPGDDTATTPHQNSARNVEDRDLRSLNDEDEDEEEEEDDDIQTYSYWRRPHAKTPKWFPPVTTPQEAGKRLLVSGEFGRIGSETRSRRGGTNFAKVILSRQIKHRQTPMQDITNAIVPNTNGTAVASLTDNIYCGQYSANSSFYYTCCKDFRLHIFDTTAPPTNPRQTPQPTERHHRRLGWPPTDEPTTMKVIKIIQGSSGGWTITDAHLSPDNERIIYSSIDSTVHMATTLDSSTTQIPLSFADPGPTRRPGFMATDNFGIWSCKFSADGNEVVAGGDGKIFVYDLLANKRTVKIDAHQDDVNSCCWADTASGNVLISASDDAFLKVWDRRSLGPSQTPSGVLIGHTEGITNVSAKGDGRYVISNGKDQALRLWDLRKMRTNTEHEAVANVDYSIRGYDYRYGHYPKPKYLAHPLDCSVMTYRGHAVLQTLIRCHFSPSETTGGQYIYSGSADGRIHIWSLDGRVVQVLDRSKTLPMAFDPSGPEPSDFKGSKPVCVRDVSWHSKEPVLMSVGWSSGHGGSVVARHEWKGLLKMAGALEDLVEKRRLEGQERSARQPRRLPGQLDSDDEFVLDSDEDDE